jgi:transposase
MTELERSQQKEIAHLREENRLLRQKLDLVIRQLFGKKSERLDPAQLELLLSDLGDADELGKDEASGAHEELLEAAPDKTRRKRKSHERRVRVPEHLPVVETIIEPDAVKACPDAWRCMAMHR